MKLKENFVISVYQRVMKVFIQCNEDTVLNLLEFRYTVADYTHENFGAYFSNRELTNIQKWPKLYMQEALQRF